MGAYKEKGAVKFITGSRISKLFKEIAQSVYPDITPTELSKFSAHMIRVSAAVLLQMADKPEHFIKTRLRWEGDSRFRQGNICKQQVPTLSSRLPTQFRPQTLTPRPRRPHLSFPKPRWGRTWPSINSRTKHVNIYYCLATCVFTCRISSFLQEETTFYTRLYAGLSTLWRYLLVYMYLPQLPIGTHAGANLGKMSHILTI